MDRLRKFLFTSVSRAPLVASYEADTPAKARRAFTKKVSDPAYFPLAWFSEDSGTRI